MLLGVVAQAQNFVVPATTVDKVRKNVIKGNSANYGFGVVNDTLMLVGLNSLYRIAMGDNSSIQGRTLTISGGTGVTVTGGTQNLSANRTWTISLPQSVATTATPTFAGANFTGTVTGISKAMIGLGNVDNTSDANKPFSPKITNDTTTLPPANSYRLAIADSSVKVINSQGKVFDLISRQNAWVLQMIVIDSTLSSYTVVDNKDLNFYASNSNNFSNSSLGKYKIYSSNLNYYLPKHIPNYTIAINLPNPSLTSSNGLQVNIVMNKRCTINFNYPIYYTLRNGQGGLTQDTDYGSTLMTPNLQTIPNTNFKASWFVSHDADIYTFYVKNQKWYIKY